MVKVKEEYPEVKNFTLKVEQQGITGEGATGTYGYDAGSERAKEDSVNSIGCLYSRCDNGRFDLRLLFSSVFSSRKTHDSGYINCNGLLIGDKRKKRHSCTGALKYEIDVEYFP